MLLYHKQLPKEMYLELFCARSGKDAALEACDQVPDLLQKPLVLDVAPASKCEWEFSIDCNAVQPAARKASPGSPAPSPANSAWKHVYERAQLLTDFPTPLNQVVLRDPARK